MNILLMMTFLLLPVLIMGLLTFVEAKFKKQVRSTLEKLLNQLVKKNKLELKLEDIEFFGRKAIGLDKKK